MDVKAREDFVVEPGMRVMVGVGFRIAVPAGWEMQLRPRSGLAARHGITLANAVGTIDSDWRGETAIILQNNGTQAFYGHRGDRIAQAIFARAPQIRLEVVESLDETERGEGGFGSTGFRTQTVYR